MHHIPLLIKDRIFWAVSFSWDICLLKIKEGEVKINKEASLQLQYSSILKGVLDLIKFNPSERYDIELESSFIINGKCLIADLVINYCCCNVRYTHIIELKFYKTITSLGTKRGAQDIFMCEVYKDLFYCEMYIRENLSDSCSCLILTDFKNFIEPKHKNSKNWAYDISNNHITRVGLYNTPIGGKENNFELMKSHVFKWSCSKEYYSCLINI